MSGPLETAEERIARHLEEARAEVARLTAEQRAHCAAVDQWAERAMRAELVLQRLTACCVCSCELQHDDGPPHCHDCQVRDKHQEAWEEFWEAMESP